MDASELYLLHRALIERAQVSVCRRHRLSAHERDDFCSRVNLHLLDNNAAVLRAFQGRSRFETYLAAVVAHCFQDWRNAEWGKWRPSAEARRLGPLAIRLETLVVRDGLSFMEAFETLKTNHGVSETEAEVQELLSRLPPRSRRSFTSESELTDLPAPALLPDESLQQADAVAVGSEAREVLARLVADLLPQDRLILKMRFHDGLKVSQISRALALDQKTLYRGIEQLLLHLRRDLESRGITAEAISSALSWHGLAQDPADSELPGGLRLFPRDAGSAVSSGGVQ